MSMRFARNSEVGFSMTCYVLQGIYSDVQYILAVL